MPALSQCGRIHAGIGSRSGRNFRPEAATSTKMCPDSHQQQVRGASLVFLKQSLTLTHSLTPSLLSLAHSLEMSSSHPTVNLVDVLARRQDAGSSSATGSSTAQHRQRLEALLEHSFTHSHEHFDYELSPDMVLSTIAIAISADGALVASTHGDHTVKIFQHDTGKFIHVSEAVTTYSLTHSLTHFFTVSFTHSIAARRPTPSILHW